jgi:hypothetical protein
MTKFATYLIQRRPAGLAYIDATSLCQWLCTVRLGVPADIRLSKFGELADAFVELSQAGWIHCDAQGHLITTPDHWLELMASRFKQPDRAALAHGDDLAREFGFTNAAA